MLYDHLVGRAEYVFGDRITALHDNDHDVDVEFAHYQVAQVRLPAWHRGRAALLGDAAWCAGPFGTGTTSALAGARVLAGALATTPGDIPTAFTRYERVLRPHIDRTQSFVIPRIGHPHTHWQRALLRTSLRALASPLGTTLNRLRGTAPPVNTIALPDYPPALTRATAGR